LAKTFMCWPNILMFPYILSIFFSISIIFPHMFHRFLIVGLHLFHLFSMFSPCPNVDG
jgi:hypothetical protein